MAGGPFMLGVNVHLNGKTSKMPDQRWSSMEVLSLVEPLAVKTAPPALGPLMLAVSTTAKLTTWIEVTTFSRQSGGHGGKGSNHNGPPDFDVPGKPFYADATDNICEEDHWL
jgi:hypothetical protein